MLTRDELEKYVDERIEFRLEQIAQKAADKAIEKVYAEIGKSFLRKAAWAVGAILLSILAWMAGRGMKLPSP